MLRALRFMDSMIQRDIMQKAAFLNDLTTFWHKFDDRVLRLKVYSLNAMRGVSVPQKHTEPVCATLCVHANPGILLGMFCSLHLYKKCCLHVCCGRVLLLLV